RVMSAAFTRVALNRTGNTPISKKQVSVTASRHVRVSGSRRTDRTSTIRLQVRTNRTGLMLKNQTVNIRFFTKPVGARGRIVPRMARSGSIRLPELTSDGVYIDCAGVTTSRTSSYGTDFYGIVVSVYNSEGALTYQGMSAAGLRDQASAAKTTAP
ncbi:hypothetical protein ACFLQU_05505, partial [Verrucomicrobiota bacterium]